MRMVDLAPFFIASEDLTYTATVKAGVPVDAMIDGSMLKVSLKKAGNDAYPSNMVMIKATDGAFFAEQIMYVRRNRPPVRGAKDSPEVKWIATQGTASILTINAIAVTADPVPGATDLTVGDQACGPILNNDAGACHFGDDAGDSLKYMGDVFVADRDNISVAEAMVGKIVVTGITSTFEIDPDAQDAHVSATIAVRAVDSGGLMSDIDTALFTINVNAAPKAKGTISNHSMVLAATLMQAISVADYSKTWS